MTRCYTLYWRNESVDEFVHVYGVNGEDAPCNLVYGGKRLLSVENGDFLYVVTVRKGLLHLLGRLEVKVTGRRQDSSPYPGETEDDNQGYEAEAFDPMYVRTDNVVPLEITDQIRCIATDGSITPLKFTAPGILDQQTLRPIRELTEASAALLDQVIADYELRRVSADDIAKSSKEVEALQAEEGGIEGAQSTKLVNHYERDGKLRAAAIRIHGTRCQACSFSFEEGYGELGMGYIEVHHKRPISSYGGAVHINPVTDLAVLCSNCHRMIHRNSSEPYSVEELRALVARTRYERTGNPYQ